MAFVFAQRVRFQHCDPAGIVFFPASYFMLAAGVGFDSVMYQLGHSTPTMTWKAQTIQRNACSSRNAGVFMSIRPVGLQPGLAMPEVGREDERRHRHDQDDQVAENEERPE